MNFKTINNFITDEERIEIIGYADNPPKQSEIANEHIKKVNAGTNGWSVLCDFTKTSISTTASQFQGDSTLLETVPEIYHSIADRISSSLNISAEHVFFQYIALGVNGRVASHYDVGLPGFVTYKCNIVVSGPDVDVIHVDKSNMEIKPLDLYCFEANFYRHWMDSQDVRRIHLSYGFLIPYADLAWTPEDPRVRLSNRIWKAFIKE
jgi:hypothetical protein